MLTTAIRRTGLPLIRSRTYRRLRLLLAALLLLLPLSPAHGQQEPRRFLQSLEPHKPIYFAHSWLVDGANHDRGDENQEVIFQISVKKRIWAPLYFGYSQKSFWQVYDGEDSRPIRENNYNPELFLEFQELWGVDLWQVGLLEHESNGGAATRDDDGNVVNRSRTWNRSYLMVKDSLIPGGLALAVKAWVVLDQEDSENGSFGEDNPDIQRYLGSGELYAHLGDNAAGATFMFRRGWKPGTETYRLDAWVAAERLLPLEDSSLSLFFQAFAGYGDSLIDYNRRIERVSLGISFR